MDHLAARLDVVVVAVNHDQAGIGQLAVDVVPQRVILRHDAVLDLRRIRRLGRRRRIRIDLRRVHHLAAVIERVTLLRQEAICLGDPVVAAVDHLVVGGEVIIVAVNLDKAGVLH